jgi:hypothetical protein
MISDRLSRSARRATSGEPLTLLLIATSILGGIGLAIACSYRPIALWWVMVVGTAFNAVRFIARLSRQSRADRPTLPPAYVRLAALAARAFAWLGRVFRRGGPPASKASLDRQHTRFLVWFTEHNLLWTTIGFGVSLLLWYRFGPTIPALVVMAALMSCALFAALGAAAGASAPMLGLCWREPCRTPDFRSLRRIVHDIGCVVVLANRRDYAARCDWAKGGRFHELFLTVDDLARAGIEPGLEAVLDADDAAARRALARKERFDRALALTPVFAAGVLAALLAVPPLAGSEPLPSLWTILARSTNPNSAASREQEEQRGARDESRAPSSQRGGDESASTASQTSRERPDITGRGGESSITGDAVASARGDGAGTAGDGAGAQAGDRTGDGERGAAGSGATRDGESNGAGGRGGGPRGYGTSGVAPQRAESPAAPPDAPVNPGKAIEVVLPAFSQARDDGRDEPPGDDPAGTKRKATAPGQPRASQGRSDAPVAPGEPVTREPVQRLPNWIVQLLKAARD